jgi:hypothetical protein
LWLALTSAGVAATVLTATFLLLPSNKTGTVEAGQLTTTPSTTSPSSSIPSSPTPPTTSSSTPPVTLTDDEQAKLADAVKKAVLAESPKSTVGLVVYDTATSDDVASVNGDTPLYTASVVKLLIAIDAMHDDGWITPDANTLDDLTNMLEGSNDGIASAFWVDDGGTAIIKRMVELIGLDHTSAPTDPGEWGMTKMSANDVIATYQFIDEQMPDDASATIMNALAGARNPADDGFAQYFGIPDAFTSTPWAVKQGWMELKSALVLNTTGVVGSDSRYVIALLTQQPVTIGWTKGRAAVTAGMTAAATALTTVLSSS